MASADLAIANITKSPECMTPSAFDKKERRQSAKVGTFNLISTMIGGGALSLPFAISRSGLILGFIILAISAALSVFSFDILVASSRRTGSMTYDQIAYSAFGRKMSLFVTAIIAFNIYVASIAYCVLIGDLIKPVVCYIGGISDDNCGNETLRRIIIGSCILLVSPFCYMKQINALKYTSVISMTSVTILTGIITIHTMQNLFKDHPIYYMDNAGHTQLYHMKNIWSNVQLWPSEWKDVIYVFPVFGISFLCHFNIPQVHSELRRPTRKRIRKVLLAVVLSCFTLYSIISFFGYFYSMQYTCGNILLNYNQDNPIVTFGRLCLGFVLLFTFPLLILPGRTSVHTLLNACSCLPKKLINIQTNDNNDNTDILDPPTLSTTDNVLVTNINSSDPSNQSSSKSASLLDLPSDIHPTSLNASNIGNKQIVKVNTDNTNTEQQSIDWGQSLEPAIIDDNDENDNYSLISDIMDIDNDIKANKKKIVQKEKKKHNNFVTYSFSHTNSPLYGPQDALGIVNNPTDVLLLADEEFTKPFKNLRTSVTYKPSKLFFILETTIMIVSSVIISYLTQSVMVLWGLLGSTVSFLIAFTLPGFFYFKLRIHKGFRWRNILSLSIAVLSFFAIGLCTWQSVLRLDVKPCPTQPPNSQ